MYNQDQGHHMKYDYKCQQFANMIKMSVTIHDRNLLSNEILVRETFLAPTHQ